MTVPTLSEEEVAFYRKTFAAFDLDGNGTISAEELGIGLRDLGMDRQHGSIRRMIDAVDQNGDQELDFDEFLQLVKSPQLARLFENEGKNLARPPSAGGAEKSKICYGQTPTPLETKESIATGLKQLKLELDKIPNDKKEGYSRALKECPHLIGDDFLLMFLRAEVFQAKPASLRLAGYWDRRVEIFGEKAFMRLTQDEALADDSDALSLGLMRPTGQTDPDGRAILFADWTREGKAECDHKSLLRAVFYIHLLILEDERAQRNGVVVIVKPPDSLGQLDVKFAKMLFDDVRGVAPLRLGGIHYLHPKSSILYCFKVIRLLLGKKLRRRIRIVGVQDDVLESMAAYGIPASAVPDLYGGDLEYDNRQEWLDDRRAIEAGQK